MACKEKKICEGSQSC